MKEEEVTPLCLVCDDHTVPSSDFTINLIESFPSCNHGDNFCENCFSRYIQNKIDDGFVKSITCPYPFCKSELHSATIKLCINESQFSSYEDQLKKLSAEFNGENGAATFYSSLNSYFLKAMAFKDDVYHSLATIIRRTTTDSKRCPKCRFIIEKDGNFFLSQL